MGRTVEVGWEWVLATGRALGLDMKRTEGVTTSTAGRWKKPLAQWEILVAEKDKVIAEFTVPMHRLDKSDLFAFLKPLWPATRLTDRKTWPFTT